MKLKLTIITAFILFGVARSFAQQADFTGKWKLDTLNSDFGHVPHFVIFHDAAIRITRDSIYLTTVNAGADGHDHPASTVTYALNGNTNERISGDSLKVVGSFGYTDDKKGLIKKQTYTVTTGSPAVSKTIQDSWALSADGKQLTVKRELKSFNKREVSYTIIAVYDRQ